MDDRGRKERRHRHDVRRGRVDEHEQMRGHQDKRRRREEDRPRRHKIKSLEVHTQIQESPFKALKSLQQSPTGQGHSAFVQQWLGEVDGEEVKKPREKMLSSPLEQLAHREQSAIAELETLHKTTSRRNSHQKHPRNDVRHSRRHTSTDSSMLQPVNESLQVHTRTKGAAETVHNRRSTNRQDDLRKRKYSSDDEISSSSELPQTNEIFDKRRRHKTREGRYDAKAKESKAAVEESTAKKKTKKAKRGDAAKISRAAGEELIRSFASNKIAQERLTMRPGVGIFRNGKASSPSRKRGVSDLAFSEMDFLSHSKNKPTAVEKEVVTSKHGQKLQRERERTRNEISDYFAPRQPLQAIAPNRQEQRSSIIASDKAATTVAPSEFGGTSYFERASPQRGRSVVKEQYLGFRTNISSPRKLSRPAPPQEPIYVQSNVETERSGSSSTSYVSWSETVKSQPRHSSPARRMDKKEPISISSSPGMLRMRLIESGMLDGLGLTLCRPSVNNAGNTGPHLGHSSSESMSHRDGSPLQQQGREPGQPRSHLLDRLRRQQLEVARRAMLSSEFVVPEERSNVEVPRKVLASRAYLRPPPSSVPRRPATATPVRQSSRNRVLSRYSPQNEMMQDPGARDDSARPSAEFDQEGPCSSRQAEDYSEYYADLPSHIRMPVNGNDNRDHQLWAQDQMAELDYGARMEAGPSYEFEKDGQSQYEQYFDQEQEEHVEQPFVLEPDYQENVRFEEEITQPFERPYHKHTPHFREERRADLAIDYSQPPPEPDPVSQCFRTPRGQSYFQQRGFGGHGLQDDTDPAGLLEDDQLEGFWATKRW